MASPGYLRFPHIANGLVVFVAADDVWLAPVAGGRAWRFTTDEAQAATPRLTPDGTQVAWASARDGSAEVYAASLADGTSTRLTYWGTSWARVSGWTPAGEVLAISAANQPFFHYTRARALTTALSGRPGAERVLPFGPVSDLSLGASDGTVGLLTGTLGSVFADPAYWKRYRGGTAGRLWVGPATAIVSDTPGAAGRNSGGFRHLLADLPAQFASPMIVAGRLAFISDHEGTGNVYSCALDGSDLRRHTDHEGWYARQASTDGQRIVYARGGELWLLDDLQAAAPVRLDVTLGSPVRGRAPRLVTAEDHVGSLSVDRGGRASAVEVRGTVHWLTHRDGRLGPCRWFLAPGRVSLRSWEPGDRWSGRPTPMAATPWRSAPATRQVQPIRLPLRSGSRPASLVASAGWRPLRTAARSPSRRRTGGCGSSTSGPARCERSPRPTTGS